MIPGEIAALSTAALWAVTSILFTLAGRALPLTLLNFVRTGLAAGLLALTLLLTTGQLWPAAARSARVFDLALSGLIGLAIGDNLLFHGYQWIGPRLTSLLMTLVPPISAIIAWLHLGERLTPADLVGMALVLGGGGWVVVERGPSQAGAASEPGPEDRPSSHERHRHRTLGVLCGIGGALCQSVGAIFAKRGMTAIAPLPATLVRMVAAAAALALVLLVTGRAASARPGLWSKRLAALTLSASFLGPYLGVWLSLVSLHRTRAGIALTLMAMSPILVIPVSRFALGERPTRRAIAGTLMAVCGAAWLLLRS
jgi:drug/metabolite transporter (DMT)-like permease